MVSLREARTADLPRMAAIQAAALRQLAADEYTDAQLDWLVPEGISSDAFPDPTAEQRRAVVATVGDGTLVGWGCLNVAHGMLAAVFVAPGYTRQGVGQAVVTRLESIARAAGITNLSVNASLNAAGFYESLGFTGHITVDVSAPDAPRIPGIEMTKDL